jgi:hypothetical protein
VPTVPVEAQRGDAVDGVAAPVLTDAVVPAGDVEISMVKKLGEHVDRYVGVGVAVGVGDDAGLVDLDAVDGA